MDNFGTIWDFTDVNPKRLRQSGASLRKLLQSHSSPIGDVLLGHGGRTGSKDEMRQLEAFILHKIGQRREAVDYLRALQVVIERGFKAGLFEVCPPRIPTLTKRHPSPFDENTIANLGRYRQWREVLQQNACENTSLELKIEVGRALTSAVLQGCLLEQRILESLLRHIDTPPVLTDERVSYELSLPWGKEENQEFRRWTADPLTELLLYRLQGRVGSEPEDWGKRPADTAVRAFFKSTGLNRGDCPKTLSDLLSVAKSWWQNKLPLGLIDYAARTRPSHSLESTSWYRLLGLEPPNASALQTAVVTQLPESDAADGLSDGYSIDWFDRARVALRDSDKGTVRRNLERLNSEFPDPYDPAHLFTRWAIFMLNVGSAAGNPLKLTTIRGYFGPVGGRILGQLGHLDLSTLSADALEEIYAEVIGDARSANHRRNLARGVREFHRFLVAEYHADPIDEGEVLGIGRGLIGVDANLISVDEYSAVLAHLNSMQLEIVHPDLTKIARLVVSD